MTEQADEHGCFVYYKPNLNCGLPPKKEYPLLDKEALETQPKSDHIPEWMQSCNVCDEGICSYVNRLLEKKLVSSVREAAKQIEKSFIERHGVSPVSAEAIRQRYIKIMPSGSKRTTKPSKPKSRAKRDKSKKSQAPISGNSNLKVIRAEVQVVAESILADTECKPEVKLKGAKKDFLRDKNNPPDNMTAEQSAAWQHYFTCAEIVELTAKLLDHYRNQLPKELPEYQANRGRPKKQK